MVDNSTEVRGQQETITIHKNKYVNPLILQETLKYFNPPIF